MSSAPLLPKSCTASADFLRPVGHGLETVGQIEQHRIGRAQRAVLVLELHAQRFEAPGGLLRARGRLEHRGGELLEPGLEGLRRDPGQFRRRHQGGQSLHRDAHPLRELVQRIGRLQRRPDHRGQARRRQGHAEPGQHAVDPACGVGQAAEVALDRAEGRARLVDGADEDLGSLGCH
ncbi:hypothetical protein LJB71_12085 [Thermomonas sp. S9]|uniref:hypothetical protein n=1 Tax=Thermomonas sp. S9 TaxID=2885203 RepID=UPI00216B358D|nr:hypothetical protein [Thermomonas sp. S9]MCR6496882.1 hypothetical protein [Thermomonas sp. S9]